jgi:hypothetical protein
MSMREQNAGQILEARARLQDLALGTLTAIDQESVLVVFDNLCGKSAFGRRRGGGSTKEKYFEQQ